MAQQGPERLEICPYDKSHVILRSVMQTHLYKCSRAHGYSLVKCSFNTTHHVRPEELQAHEASCPDRHSHEAGLCEFKGESSLSVPVQHIPMPRTEQWNDGVGGSYKPGADNDENFILRSVKPGLPPAERKLYRRNQCMKAKEFTARRELFGPITTQPAPAKALPRPEVPLRLPSTAPTSSNESMSMFLIKSLKQVSINKSEQPKVRKPLHPLSEQNNAGWWSTGRGKAILELKKTMVGGKGRGRGRGRLISTKET